LIVRWLKKDERRNPCAMPAVAEKSVNLVTKNSTQFAQVDIPA
jgi:hypothetical protein